MRIVDCINVIKIYRQGEIEVRALDGLSLTVGKGDFMAIAGPSGSGKTTLLNIIGGLDQADEGRVILDGRDLGGMTQSELADLRLQRVGFVFQSYNLVPVLTALENVEFVMLLQRVPRDERIRRAKSILDDVGLEGMYDRRPAALSGGQQQRVAVARAIVSSPSIVLADEPTANLDSKTGEGLLEIMRRMNEEKNVTFIFSTHDRMVMNHARRLILLKDGRVVEDNLRHG
jgi:putative ABC transport system ATP-binding protein